MKLHTHSRRALGPEVCVCVLEEGSFVLLDTLGNLCLKTLIAWSAWISERNVSEEFHSLEPLASKNIAKWVEALWTVSLFPLK